MNQVSFALEEEMAFSYQIGRQPLMNVLTAFM